MTSPIKGSVFQSSRLRGDLTTVSGPPVLPPDPAEDVSLDAIFQETVRGICNYSGDLVRPRWQPVPPKQPDPGTDWAAVGVTTITPDDGPAFIHNPSSGNGTSTSIRHETIDVLVSFYGPNSQMYAGRFRDGIAVPQNTEPLSDVDMRWIECGPLRQVPELVNAQWIRRQDMTARFRRKVTRVYGIESLLIADVDAFDDTSVAFTVVVPPDSNLEP
jgi:hypothetical protein